MVELVRLPPHNSNLAGPSVRARVRAMHSMHAPTACRAPSPTPCHS